jgi:hypothetical protein
MKNRKLIVLAMLLGTLTGLGSAPAHADPVPVPDYCAAPDDLNCTLLVENRIVSGYYCQRVEGQVPRCELFWPFRNPIVNAHAGMGEPGAFPADYLQVKNRAATLERRLLLMRDRLDRKNDRIERLRERIERLRD